MRTMVGLGLAALVLAGCSQKGKEEEAYTLAVAKAPPGVSSPGAPAADAAVAADAAAAPAPAMMEPTPPDGDGVRVAAGPPMLAYAYSYGLALPHAQVDVLRRRHEAACAKAGYQVCQVVASSIHDLGDADVSGQLELRATPAWLRVFRDGLGGEAKAAGGKLTTSEVSSEDLSRQIVDTDAQLKAKLVLRDRLQGLLANRPGRLSDLLAVERELARVQAEIDSAQSELAVMRARVAMSAITVDYASSDLVGAPVRSPLKSSVKGVLGTMAASLATIIDLAAGLAPWGLVVGGVAWLLRKRIARLRWPFHRRPAPAAS